MTMTGLEVRECAGMPRLELTKFLNSNTLAFDNLDWFTPNERFNESGCFAVLEDHEIKAILAATPENPGAAWLRFFHAERDGRHTQYFNMLMSQVLPVLRESGAQSVYSLAPYEWLERLLLGAGFIKADSIVTLQRGPAEEKAEPNEREYIIKEMTLRDLAAVEIIDSEAFPTPWQLTFSSLERTYHLSAFHTVAIRDGEVIGYQMTTNAFDLAHLARLAVAPRWQHEGVGRAMVEDMLETCTAIGIDTFSVNTQSTNTHSLALYHSLGYMPEDRDIIVMSLSL